MKRTFNVLFSEMEIDSEKEPIWYGMGVTGELYTKILIILLSPIWGIFWIIGKLASKK